MFKIDFTWQQSPSLVSCNLTTSNCSVLKEASKLCNETSQKTTYVSTVVKQKQGLNSNAKILAKR